MLILWMVKRCVLQWSLLSSSGNNFSPTHYQEVVEKFDFSIKRISKVVAQKSNVLQNRKGEKSVKYAF